jgi:hypothetical protein
MNYTIEPWADKALDTEFNALVDKQAELLVNIIGRTDSRMFPEWERYYVLWSALKEARPIEGNFVQYGVHNGEQAFFMASLATETVHLFESFEGITTVGEFDNEFYKENTFKPDREIFDKTMSAFENVSLNTLTEFDKVEKISLLYVDVATYEPTKNALENLFPKIVENGILMVDTHDNYSTGAAKAMQELATSLGKEIQTLPTGILVLTR